MTKSEERRWREYYAASARRWKHNPWALVGNLEAIMGFQDLTAGQKIRRMQLAIEAYNEAMKEASSNAESMPN